MGLRRGSSCADFAQVPIWQGVNPSEKRAWWQHISVERPFQQSQLIQNWRGEQRKQRLDLRREVDSIVKQRVVKGFVPESIPHQIRRPALRIAQDECEPALELFEALWPPGLPGAKDKLAIGIGPELRPSFAQGLADLAGIGELAVERKCQAGSRLIRVCAGLSAHVGESRVCHDPPTIGLPMFPDLTHQLDLRLRLHRIQWLVWGGNTGKASHAKISQGTERIGGRYRD